MATIIVVVFGVNMPLDRLIAPKSAEEESLKVIIVELGCCIDIAR